MKGSKKIGVFLGLITSCVISVIALVVFANSDLTIIDMSYKNYHSAIHYSDDRLLYWSSTTDKTYENVKKYYIGYDDTYEPYILKNDGTLTYTTLEGTKTKTNIQDFYALYDKDMQIIMYLDNQNKLYFETYGEEFETPEYVSNVSKIFFGETDSIFAYQVEDKLYAFLANTYENINKSFNDDTLTLYEPKLVAENVKDFGDSYYINNDNTLFLYGELKFENIKSVDKIHYLDTLKKVFEITTLSNEKNIILTSVSSLPASNGAIYTIGYNKIKLDETIKKVIEVNYDMLFLTESGNLYEYDDYELTMTKTGENIKDIVKMEQGIFYDDVFAYLNDNNEFHIKCLDSSCEINSFYDLIKKEYLEQDEDIKLLKNVDSIEYLNEKFILMTDKSIFRFGNNKYNEFRDCSLESTSSFIKLNELINNNQSIKPNQIKSEINKSVEIYDTVYLDYIVIPENTEESTFNHTIEDESLFQYHDDINGYEAIKEGATKFCIISTEDENIKDCTDITIYPRLTGIEIEQGESINVETYEPFKISIIPTPLNSAGKLQISFNYNDNFNAENYYYDYEMDDYIYAEDNELYLEATKTGRYELYFYDYNSGYGDTIIVNVTQKVYAIEPVVPKENFDGVQNVFMYLKKSNKLNLSYKIYSESATNHNVIWSSSDASVATVDQNGVVTAYKSGRTKITMTAADGGGATATINLLVNDGYGNIEFPGDVNLDESIDILDVIRLRKYLAGLEDDL